MYYIAERKHLDASEWSDPTHDFLKDRAWITAYSAEKYEEGLAVLHVTGDSSEIVSLIDPSGYNHARYVGIERATK